MCSISPATSDIFVRGILNEKGSKLIELFNILMNLKYKSVPIF
jgi:hypothetical protein